MNKQEYLDPIIQLFGMLGLFISMMFAEIAWYILAIGILVFFDTILGIRASKKSGKGFESDKAFKGVLLKVLIYPWAIYGVYIVDIHLLDSIWKGLRILPDVDNLTLRVATIGVILHELISINEHTVILWKKSLFQRINVVVRLFKSFKDEIQDFKD